jgi:membrane dipeptidase
MPAPSIPIFDGHNDVLLRLVKLGPDAVRSFIEGDGRGHIDLPRAREGGLAGGMFAIFVPSPEPTKTGAIATAATAAGDTPPPPDISAAQQAVLAMAALLFRIERESNGRVRVCRGVDDIRGCLKDGALATVLHIEGAEAIGPDLDALEVFYQAGLRSLGPVWSRSNIFGHGVPFRFPSSPDTGPGLTDAGKELIRACNRMKIMVDLSHLNEQGFWDVAKLSTAPLVATHSNAHVVCEHSRNLTDRQLAAIAESDGMVGVNYAVNFVRPDGKRESDTPLSMIVDHLEHLLKHLGEDRVGLGSDFDGAGIPKAMGSAAGLQHLVEDMRLRQFGDALIEKICHRNWLRVLEKTWG